MRFVFICLGGLVWGVVISFLIIGFGVFVGGVGMEDVRMDMVIEIVRRFVIYLVVEEMWV